MSHVRPDSANKLFAPLSSSQWVDRPHLIQRLEQTLSATARLSLISAQAGSGKSTLLSGWLAASPVRAAWLSLDTADNDLSCFWIYVLAALRVAQPVLGQSMWLDLQASSPLTSLSIEAAHALLVNLLNEIAAQPDRLVLILDDYHVITHTAIHDTLAYEIDHLPETLKIVIASRADPPLPLHRWRVRGQLLEVRAADLLEEIRQGFVVLHFVETHTDMVLYAPHLEAGGKSDGTVRLIGRCRLEQLEWHYQVELDSVTLVGVLWLRD